jgi:hypothetical protein
MSAVRECGTWIKDAELPEVKRAREKAVEQIAGAASVSYCEAIELAEAATKHIASKVPPGDRRDLRLCRLVAEVAQTLRGLAMAGTRSANRADAELRRLTLELADKTTRPSGAPLHHAVAIVLRDPLLDPEE